jgi:NAD(P)-dependent dehydrogenase (short-subunit alcohol dehydrogenase family)
MKPTLSTTQIQNRQPGVQSAMSPQPRSDRAEHPRSDRFVDRVFVISGGDSGIGRAVAIGAAKEGADVAILYYNEHDDAQTTGDAVKEYGRKFVSLAGDVGDEAFCRSAIEQILARFERIDVLVNNAGEQHVKESIAQIDESQLERTFRTNIFAQFFLSKAALPHMGKGSAIVNTASATAFHGSPHLLDYSSTKGAIVAFTRSLSSSVVSRGIRVNAVAPGPIWTPLIPASYDDERIAEFGKDTPMGRPGQPDEVASAILFLASREASYISGEILHVNGGDISNT